MVGKLRNQLVAYTELLGSFLSPSLHSAATELAPKNKYFILNHFFLSE